MIIVHDLSGLPVSESFHSSHKPATASAGEPSRAVKYHGCLPLGVSCHSFGPRKNGFVATVSAQALTVASF